jgi:hypothetical protein
VISLQIVTAGAAWLIVGGTLGRGIRPTRPELVNRIGALALIAISGLIWLQSLAVALL